MENRDSARYLNNKTFLDTINFNNRNHSSIVAFTNLCKTGLVLVLLKMANEKMNLISKADVSKVSQSS